MTGLVYIFADESCLGVQFKDRDSPGGAAGLVEVWKAPRWSRRDYWLSEPATTNNRMALRSAIEGLRLLSRPCRVLFTSDSQYLVHGMREWIHAWSRQGWRRRSGPIENVDLWRTLAATARRHAVDWRWVRGHAGHPQNEYANVLAVRAARMQDASNGLRPSGFEEWLRARREEREEFLEFHEGAAPGEARFEPAPSIEL